MKKVDGDAPRRHTPARRQTTQRAANRARCLAPASARQQVPSVTLVPFHGTDTGTEPCFLPLLLLFGLFGGKRAWGRNRLDGGFGGAPDTWPPGAPGAGPGAVGGPSGPWSGGASSLFGRWLGGGWPGGAG
ncbi:MAG: hypothetical protein IRZ33_04550, partial [Alicyclobacillaceae bacterium]|nr:hypothetical protein [Alicyclobacillaceae bacterium]